MIVDSGELGLSDQLADGFALAELDGAAGGGGDVFLGGVQAERGEDGRVDVFDLGGLFGVFECFGIGFTHDRAAPDRTTGEREAEAGRPVVPAAAQVDLGRAAELAAAHHDGALEQLSLLQVAQERGEGRVENLELGSMDLVVGDVGVPAVERDLDAANADFNQTASGQTAAPER